MNENSKIDKIRPIQWIHIVFPCDRTGSLFVIILFIYLKLPAKTFEWNEYSSNQASIIPTIRLESFYKCGPCSNRDVGNISINIIYDIMQYFHQAIIPGKNTIYLSSEFDTELVI